MSHIEFREIDKNNFYKIVKLHETLTDNQKVCVARNDYSIAEASVYPKNAYYRAIYYNEEPIGFFMIFIPSEESIKNYEKDFFLWRFMIANAYQRKGFGAEALKMIIRIAKEKGFTIVKTSCEMIEEGPYEFYIKFGFKEDGKKYYDDTGNKQDYEIGLEYKITD